MSVPKRDAALTVPEVAEWLRVAEKTVYRLAQRGEIPAFKVGGTWRFLPRDIERWIIEQMSSLSGSPGRVSSGISRRRP